MAAMTSVLEPSVTSSVLCAADVVGLDAAVDVFCAQALVALAIEMSSPTARRAALALDRRLIAAPGEPWRVVGKTDC